MYRCTYIITCKPFLSIYYIYTYIGYEQPDTDSDSDSDNDSVYHPEEKGCMVLSFVTDYYFRIITHICIIIPICHSHR
jgi:hypothetical protein